MNLALVPAAGRSSRLGRPKALLPIAGRPLIDRLLGTLRQGGIDESIVVVAPGEDRLLAHCRARGVAVAVNTQVRQGMLSSVLCGLNRAGDRLAGARSLTICPVDFPWLEAETVAALLAALADSPYPIVVPRYGDRQGHPLVLAPAVSRDIERLDLGIGLRGLLALHPVETVDVDDPGVLRDLDTWRDHDRLRKATRSRD